VQIESLLRHPDLEILRADPTSAGRQKARLLQVMAPSTEGPVRFRVKWRALDTAHGLNDPRRELAVHALQKLFLRPFDWVLPPTTGHCFDTGHYRSLIAADAGASFEETSCVFGTVSYWLEHGRALEAQLFDKSKLDMLPSYRRSLADTNLLAYLAGNGDTHGQQFVLTGSEQNPRVYLVDYTISLSDYRNPRLRPEDDWSIIHVPLAAESIARLRELRLSDLERLLVIEEYESRSGVMLSVTPSAPFSKSAGLRWVAPRLQVGLTETEISYVWTRLRELLARIDRGEIRTF
jgi:hypothetical protein